MAATQKQRSVSLKNETLEFLQMIKSCYMLGKKRNTSYDDIIVTFVKEGIKTQEPKVYEIFKLASETASEDNEEQINSEDIE